MCGIAGFVNIDGAPADAAVLSAMTDLVRHRGPDDRGTLCVSLRGGLPDTALGFHRLKIVDVSGHGRQPMTSADGSIALLFNGEIGRPEWLRRSLRARQHSELRAGQIADQDRWHPRGIRRGDREAAAIGRDSRI